MSQFRNGVPGPVPHPVLSDLQKPATVHAWQFAIVCGSDAGVDDMR
jgi:hypothetical protein